MTPPILYIVVPCYNEQDVLPQTAPMFLQKLKDLSARGKISEESRVLFINDGSRDDTWRIICDLSRQDRHFMGIAQSRNRGHQNAVLAGLMEAMDKCDITISIDCDGQDDINAMDDMVDAYLDGCEIVYGVRSSRETDSFFKRATAQGFYRMLNMMGAEVVYNHADYRLMSRRALDGLAQFGEVNLFLRGIVPMIGYRTGTVEYARGERFAGESKYPLSKMLNFALDGVTSLSVRPIRLIAAAGALIFGASLVWGLVLFILLLCGQPCSGTTALAMCVWAACGLQLGAIGVIGEYLGKIYLETKARPRYLIETVLDDDRASE